MREGDEETVISLSDLVFLLKKAKRPILLSSALCSLLFGFYALSRPVVYEAEATFREKENSASGLEAPSFSSLLASGGAKESSQEAISTLLSRSLLEQLTLELDLRGKITRTVDEPSLLGKIRDNLITEKQRLLKRKTPSFPDPKPLLAVRTHRYDHEYPISLDIQFIDDETYRIQPGKSQGRIGQPLALEGAEITLVSQTENSLKGERFRLTLSSASQIAEELGKKIRIEADKNDPHLLLLWTTDSNRHSAAAILNHLMRLYQKHLRETHENTAAEQLVYLGQRQQEMTTKLQRMLEEYAEALSADANNLGFSSSSKAMELLAGVHQKLKEKILGIDLMIQQQAALQQQGLQQLIASNELNLPAGLKEPLSQYRSMQQQKDSVLLALERSTPKEAPQLQSDFKQQIKELEQLRLYANEAAALRLSVQENQPLPECETLMQNPCYLAKSWTDTVLESETLWKEAPREKKSQAQQEWQNHKSSFLAYLDNLIHHFRVYEKTLKENLTHQQNSVSEFQGIDLETARALYINYSRKQNEVETEIAQTDFLMDKISRPNFDIASLPTVLQGRVSPQMISDTSALALKLKDERNRSEKEQERIQKELQLQKDFLYNQLLQSRELSQLQAKLLKQKISSLLRTTLGLLQQQSSILEENIYESLQNQLRSLEEEKEILVRHQKELQRELAKIPKEWADEKLIEQQIAMNKNTAEEITKLVESKNISQHLQVIQSTPVDPAIPEIHPKSPRTLLYLLLGAFFGGFISLLSFLTRSAIHGLPATPDNLTRKGGNLCGTLSLPIQEPYSDENLNTLRRLTSFSKRNRKGSFLILESRISALPENLAKLLHKEGKRICLLPLTFAGSAEPQNPPGLLQYLEGKADSPQIHNGAEYDWIEAGGVSRYSSELLANRRFPELKARLEKDYDLLIWSSHTSIDSAEAENLFTYFQDAAIVLRDEKLANLTPYLNKQITFLFERCVN